MIRLVIVLAIALVGMGALLLILANFYTESPTRKLARANKRLRVLQEILVEIESEARKYETIDSVLATRIMDIMFELRKVPWFYGD